MGIHAKSSGGAGRQKLQTSRVRNALKNGLSDAVVGATTGGVGLPYGGNVNGSFNINGLPQFGYGTQLSQSDTLFLSLRNYLVSNFRQMLSQAYVEIGLIQTVVNVPVDDGLRGGVEIKSQQLDPDQIQTLQEILDRRNILSQSVGQAMKWNRLFGGAGILVLTDQPCDTPLDIEAIGPDSRLEFRAVDMWELFYDKQNLDGDGYDPDIHDERIEFYTYYSKKVHKSRVMKMAGLIAPSFVRPRLRGWGFSVVESLIRSINQFIKSSELSFEVLDEFKLDIYKIKGLSDALMSQEGTEATRSRIALANYQKNYQNAVTMDADDDYMQKELSFAGVAEMQQSFRLQIAADLRMPLTKLFGMSSAGFNSGEDDIENYNAMVESEIRGKCKWDILKILELLCQQEFGYIPDDLSITFKPLRILSSEQEETVKTQKFTRIMQAFQAGLMSAQSAMEACNKANLLEVQLDPEELVVAPSSDTATLEPTQEPDTVEPENPTPDAPIPPKGQL